MPRASFFFAVASSRILELLWLLCQHSPKVAIPSHMYYATLIANSLLPTKTGKVVEWENWGVAGGKRMLEDWQEIPTQHTIKSEASMTKCVYFIWLFCGFTFHKGDKSICHTFTWVYSCKVVVLSFKGYFLKKNIYFKIKLKLWINFYNKNDHTIVLQILEKEKQKSMW